MIFLRASFCLSAVSLSRQRHDILGFSLLSFVARFAFDMANPQKFGSEFHLRSSPSAFRGGRKIGSKSREEREIGSESREEREIGSESREEREIGSESREEREIGSKSREEREIGSKSREEREIGSESKEKGDLPPVPPSPI